MNNAVRPSLEVIFAERGICRSCEQCTGPTYGNADLDSNVFPNPALLYVWIEISSVCVLSFHVSFFFFFFLPEVGFTWDINLPVDPVHCARDPLVLWTSTHWSKMALSMGPMYCSRDPQTSFFTKPLIKNGSHSTIHTFKNYFAIVFSVFSKISCIQTDP